MFALLQDNKHFSNIEALIEIYAMSKCQYFVHGYSGMAEAVTYINYPLLHDQSVVRLRRSRQIRRHTAPSILCD